MRVMVLMRAISGPWRAACPLAAARPSVQPSRRSSGWLPAAPYRLAHVAVPTHLPAVPTPAPDADPDRGRPRAVDHRRGAEGLSVAHEPVGRLSAARPVVADRHGPVDADARRPAQADLRRADADPRLPSLRRTPRPTPALPAVGAVGRLGADGDALEP